MDMDSKIFEEYDLCVSKAINDNCKGKWGYPCNDYKGYVSREYAASNIYACKQSLKQQLKQQLKQPIKSNYDPNLEF